MAGGVARVAATVATLSTAVLIAGVGTSLAHTGSVPTHAGGILLRFRSGVRPAQARQILAKFGLSAGRPIIHTGYRLIPVRAADAPALAVRLEARPEVADVELNYLRRATAVPNDPIYAKSVHQRYLDMVRLPQAWATEKGSSSVVIAIVDTGVSSANPDLVGRVLPGKTFVAGTMDATDDNGHGTRVASIAAAATNNGVGMAGVAWNATVLPVKVLDSTGYGDDASIASGITWAADNGANVINLSLGSEAASSVVANAVAYAVSKNVVVVAAAGNAGTSVPQYPAADSGVIAVAATDWAGESTDYTSYGPWIGVAAPGNNILGVDRSGYSPDSGTSFAAPIVSGVAALVVAEHPTWTQQQVVNDIEHTARDLGAPGFDDEYGYGVVDAYAAIGGGRADRSGIPADAAEPNDVPDRATVLTSSTFLPASLSPEGDVDWYVRQVTAPGQLTWQVAGPPWNQGEGDPVHSMTPDIEAYGPDLRYLGHAPNGETLTVPVTQSGNYYLKVSNANPSRAVGFNATGSSLYQYKVSGDYSSGSLPNQPFFMPKDPYNFDGDWSGVDSETVAAGDVTGDGRSDVVVTTGTSFLANWFDQVAVFPQLPDGLLGDAVRLPLLDPGQRINQPAIGDVNGDGHPDLVLAGLEGIDIYLENGGSVAPTSRISNTTDAWFVALADLNRDGRTDIVALLGRPGTTTMSLTLLMNTASGFTPVTLDSLDRPCVSGCASAVVGDVNGDGRLDIVEDGLVPNSSGGNTPVLRTWLQSTTGGFTPADTQLPDNPGPLALGDLNGDGRADVLTTTNGQLSIFAGSASGLAPPTAVAGATSSSYLVGDFNGDGRADIAGSGSTGYGTNPIMFYLQSSSGSLTPVSSTAGTFGRGAWSAAADINGDGKLDIVTSDGVLRSYNANWPRAPLWIRSSTPADDSQAAPTTGPITLHVARQLEPTSVSASTVQLANGYDGSAVAHAVAYDAASGTITITPSATLAPSTPYVVTVSGLRDLSGDPMERAYKLHFQVGAISDTTPPDTYITTAIPRYVNYFQNVNIDFDANEPVQRFDCSEDGGAWFVCSSPINWDTWTGTSLDSGTHTVSVRAVDDAGNVDPTPATVRWTVTSSQPANNNFANATTLSGGSGTVNGNNDFATSEVGEPATAGNPGGASVWFRWTATGSGAVQFDTGGSGFDTLLGVYTGTSVNALTNVVANDDVSATDQTSKVTFQAVAGTTYSITVDGFDAWDDAPAEGDYTLRWGSSLSSAVPDTTITSAPAASTTSTSATFDFTSTTAGSTFQCQLDASAWSTCTSPASYVGLAVATHTFAVRATDAAGNVDPTPATVTWTITAGSTTPPSSNLVVNPSFETGLPGWATWNGSLSLSTDGYDGTYAAKVTPTNGATSYSIYPTSHPVSNTTAGTAYTASAWVRSDDPGHKICLYVREYSSSNAVVSLVSSCLAATTSGWQQIPALTYTTQQSGGSVQVFVQPNGGASFEADAFSLQAGTTSPPPPPPTSSPINLPNASFESGLTGWASWNGTLGIATDGHEGTNAAKVTATNGATSYSIYPTTHPVTNVTAGTAYTATAWVRSDDPGHKICIYIREYSASNAVVALVSSCLTATTTGWQQIPAVNYTTQQSGGSLQIFVQPNGGTSFEADAFSLQTGNTSTAPPPPPPPPAPTNVINLGNPSFESGLTGWASWNGALSLATDGHEGTNAAKVTANSGVSGYSIYPTAHPVTNTTAGTAFTAGAWVRSDAAGHKICLYIREYSSSNTVVALVSSCLTTTTAWQQIPALQYTTQQSGGSLQIFIQPEGGASFEADAFSLQQG